MTKVGDIKICPICNKPFTVELSKMTQKYHLECSYVKDLERGREYSREYRKRKMFKPNIGPKDHNLPEENRYDEWENPNHKKRYEENRRIAKRHLEEYRLNQNK
jgi:hypothetical protein